MEVRITIYSALRIFLSIRIGRFAGRGSVFRGALFSVFTAVIEGIFFASACKLMRSRAFDADCNAGFVNEFVTVITFGCNALWSRTVAINPAGALFAAVTVAAAVFDRITFAVSLVFMGFGRTALDRFCRALSGFQLILFFALGCDAFLV